MRKLNTVLFISCIALTIAACKSEKQKAMETISANEKILFNDTTKMLNEQIAAKQVQIYKNFAVKYPDDTLSPGYLFKAADLATGIHKPKDAVDIYEIFLSKYANHAKAPTCLFMEGFVYDTAIRDKNKAVEKYKEFLAKYPDHQLAASAKASLDQIEMGLSDEELIKMFEAKQDSIAKAKQGT